MATNIAVLGCTLAHASGSTISLGTFIISGLLSTKFKAENKLAYTNQIIFTFTGGNGPGCSPGSVTGAGFISGTSTQMLIENTAAILEGDTGTLTGAGTDPSTGLPVTVSGSVEVSVAGQTKWGAS